MLRPDGLVKIVDFGIAKRTRLGGETLAVADRLDTQTIPGLLMGTPRYMSPEQARGLPVDAGSDLFSLGCVLYEGLTASAAVAGANPSDVLVALLCHTPLPLDRLGPECPTALAGIVCRALEKDLDNRYQSADEMLADLQSVQKDILTGSAPAHFQKKGAGRTWQTSPVPEQSTAIPKKKVRFRRAILPAVLIALASTALIYYQRAHQTRTVTDTPTAPVPLTSYPGFQRFPTFSPEGTRVAFTWDEPGKRPSNIYVKKIGSSEPVQLTNRAERNFAPAWSPDGRLIAFFQAHGPFRSSVMVMPASGGRERELTRIQFDARQIFAHWGWVESTPYLAWSPDSKWLLSLDGSGLYWPAQSFAFRSRRARSRGCLQRRLPESACLGIVLCQRPLLLSFCEYAAAPATLSGSEIGRSAVYLAGGRLTIPHLNHDTFLMNNSPRYDGFCSDFSFV